MVDSLTLQRNAIPFYDGLLMPARADQGGGGDRIAALLAQFDGFHGKLVRNPPRQLLRCHNAAICRRSAYRCACE